jgi:hypothetical protein
MKLDKDLISGIDLLVEKLSKNGVASEYMHMPDLERKSIRFLKENDLIKPSTNKKFQYVSSSEIHKIKELGIEKYLKNQNKSKLYNEPWVGHLITVIALVFGIYQWLHKSEFESDLVLLKSDSETLTKERDSLKLELSSYKSTLYDLKLKLEKKKELEK